jgi:hypothetical protein
MQFVFPFKESTELILIPLHIVQSSFPQCSVVVSIVLKQSWQAPEVTISVTRFSFYREVYEH